MDRAPLLLLLLLLGHRYLHKYLAHLRYQVRAGSFAFKSLRNVILLVHGARAARRNRKHEQLDATGNKHKKKRTITKEHHWLSSKTLVYKCKILDKLWNLYIE